MKTCPSILCLLALLPLSCTSDSAGSKPPETLKPLSERLSESNGYKQDADGNWLPKSDKRSSFESQGQAAYFQGEYAKKDYKAPDYAKKTWSGNKDFGRKEYSGNTDGSRFQQSSRLDGKGAPEAGKSAGMNRAYKTNDYATKAAREEGSRKIEKPSDAETDVRRRTFKKPEIIDWEQQRSLSLEQSKGILGH